MFALHPLLGAATGRHGSNAVWRWSPPAGGEIPNTAFLFLVLFLLRLRNQEKKNKETSSGV